MTVGTCTWRLAFALAVGFAMSLLGLSGALAQANSSNGNLPVNATVQVTCTVASAGLNFPVYSGGAAVLARTTADVSCTGPLPNGFVVEYDYGQNSTSCQKRAMRDAAGNLLAYEMYDPTQPVPTNYLGPIGDPNCIQHRAAYPGAGGPPPAPVQNPVEGAIIANQPVPSGPYSDVVIMTVWW